MKNIVCAIIIVLTLTGCKKFVDIPAPPTQIEIDNLFSDAATAESAVAGLYYKFGQQNNLLFNGLLTVCSGLSADELKPVTNQTYQAFFLNDLLPSNDQVEGTPFWTMPYNYIFHANAILEGLDNAPNIEQSVKSQLKGELLFLRALTYFYLYNLYGGVPLILTTNFQENERKPRAAPEVVLNQIVDDLTLAKSLLITQYPSATKLRANKLAATALLARVYLYQQKWAEAATQSAEVINSGIYQLGTLDNAFLSNSKEAILQFSMPITSTNVTGEGQLFIPSQPSSRPSFCLTDSLLIAFEPGDQRLPKWTNKRVVSGITYFCPYKYKIRSVASGTAKPEQITVLRLSEQFLIRAEALANQGLLMAAITQVDSVRQRAGLPKLDDLNPSISQTELLKFIYHERQVELFAEWGHRWLDLKRTGLAHDVLGALKANWQAYDVLYPIPASQIRANPSLTQNPGY